MTCIVGYRRDGDVWLGSDSAVTGEDHQAILAHPKIFRIDELIVGYRGALRPAQVLQYAFDPPPVEDADPMAYLVGPFMRDLDIRLTEHETSLVISNAPTELLVGLRGRLFHIGSRGDVYERIDAVDAIGKGATYALGALLALHDTNLDPHQLLLRSLQISAHCSQYVRSPFWVLGPGLDAAVPLE